MSKRVSFPPFVLDGEEERLWRDNKQIALRRKPFAILKYLAAHPNRLVTHEEVLEHVWAGTVVSESALRSHLHELRQVLGDGVIETVIGRGYRFVAKLEAASEPPMPAAPVQLVDSTVVGRSAELALLDAALERALTGHRQICFVTGEPGIGKTTLVDTFLASLAARKLRGVRGHCIEQYGTPEPYLPMIELLGQLRAQQGDQVLATLVRYAPSFAVQVPHLLSDAQFDDASRRSGRGAETRTMRELVEALEALCSEQLLVIVIEDLQWSDVATIDLVSLLGQRRERAKLLVIATSRRAESQTVSHPLNRVLRNLVTRADAIAIPLERIDTGDIHDFLARRFPGHAFPEAFVEFVERITGGTPLFMVSIVSDFVARKMIDQHEGRWRLAVSSDEIASYRPATVRQLIDIQLDRLTPQEQSVLEAGSLIGPQFSSALVAAALGTPVEQVEEICESLARRALFLHHAGEEDWPDGTAQTRYGVTHALVQEVCFDRAPTARRLRWHRGIAEHLEARSGDRTDELAHVLATHFEQAHLFPRALHYYVIAGTRTAQRFSLADASRLYRRAHAILAKLPETPERDAIELRVLNGLSQSVTLSSDRTRHEPVELFQRTITIARRVADIPQLYRATVNLYFRHGTLAEYAAADSVERDLVQLEQTHAIDRELRVFADGARGITAMWKGDLRRGLELLEAITADADNTGPIGGILGNADRIAFLLIYQCTTRWALGDPARALDDAQRGVEQAIRANDPYSLGANLTILARLRFLRRDSPLDIREPAERVATIPEADVWYTQSALLAGAARSQSGDRPLTQSEIDDLARMFEFRTSTFPMGAPALALPLVEIHRSVGDTTRAMALVDQMLAFIAKHDEFLFESEFLRLRGELVEPADAAAAHTYYTRSLAAARKLSAPAFELRAAIRLARLVPHARSELDVAVQRFAVNVTSTDLVEARRLLATAPS